MLSVAIHILNRGYYVQNQSNEYAAVVTLSPLSISVHLIRYAFCFALSFLRVCIKKKNHCRGAFKVVN